MKKIGIYRSFVRPSFEKIRHPGVVVSSYPTAFLSFQEDHQKNR